MKINELENLYLNTRKSNVLVRLIVWCVLASHVFPTAIRHPLQFTKMYVRELSK